MTLSETKKNSENANKNLQVSQQKMISKYIYMYY